MGSSDLYSNYWECRFQQYGELADGYIDEDYQEYEFKLRLKTVLKYIKKYIKNNRFNIKILDVGCGVGRWSIYLAKIGYSVVGVDVSESMIKTAIKKAEMQQIKNIKFYILDISNDIDEFFYNKFDVILCITVLQHITNDSDFIKAIDNILKAVKKNGIIIIMDSLYIKYNNKLLIFIRKLYNKLININKLNSLNLKNNLVKNQKLLKIRDVDYVINILNKNNNIEIIEVKGVCIFGRYLYRLLKNKINNKYILNLFKKICFYFDLYLAGCKCFINYSQPVIIIARKI